MESSDVTEVEPLKYLKTTDMVGEGYDGGSPRYERVEVLPRHALRGSKDDESREDLEATNVVDREHGGGSPHDERVEVRLRLEASVVLQVGLRDAHCVCDVAARGGAGTIISRQPRVELIPDVGGSGEAWGDLAATQRATPWLSGGPGNRDVDFTMSGEVVTMEN